MVKAEFKGITKRALKLLSGEEGFDVEFKRSINGLDSEDIVAFANSINGGAIFIGVDEITTDSGNQKGEVVGCRIGDEEKRKIIDKAESCLPPIEVEIFFENTKEIPFIRVEIQSGPKKPYCTSSGTYKIRGDGVNKALTPQRLLALFMDSEGQQFVDKFKEATDELEDELSRIHQNSLNLEMILERTFGSATNTEALADEALAYSDQAAAIADEVSRKIDAIENYDLVSMQMKLDSILENFDIEDPIRKIAREKVESFTLRLYTEGKSEDEILKELNNLWSRNIINAAYNDVITWAKTKLHDLDDSK